MRIHEMHYDVRFKCDKIDSNQKRNFTPAQIDWALNEGQWVWLKHNYGLGTLQLPHPTGFEGTEHRIQDLKALHIKSPEQQAALTATSVSTSPATVFSVKLEDLAFDHLFTTRVRVKVTKGSCTKTIGVTIVQTDDLNEAIMDPFHKPNMKFGKVLGVYARTISTATPTSNHHFQNNGTLYIYVEDGATVNEVYIDYIKVPNRMWVGTYDLTTDLSPKSANNDYIYQAGTSAVVHCELNSHVHPEIVDYAVALLSEEIEDPNLVKLKIQRKLTNK
jgi:hypothetical protein